MRQTAELNQPWISDLVRGRVSRISLDALVDVATALRRRVSFELEVAWFGAAIELRSTIEQFDGSLMLSGILTLLSSAREPAGQDRAITRLWRVGAMFASN